MFTGIVTAVGTLESATMRDGDGTFRFATGKLTLDGVQLGDSIACNGACLTVTELHPDGFSADVSRETLDCTTLGGLQAGDPVNFERALALGAGLGGHLVTGHVDGVGVIDSVTPDGESWRVAVTVPPRLAGYIAPKGSITMDGVSLTVNTVAAEQFQVMIVPHTQAETIIRHYGPGRSVNIEIDIIARYVELLLQYTGEPPPPQPAT
ncbi:MAG: riboflavin synthase [Gammaproteobacteria bacterium]|jgi:riboflavin synthase|nr:riboflavin synthase [Gammaproteobacteria bacterium]